MSLDHSDRRTFLKAAGLAGAAATLPAGVAAGATTVDDTLETSGDALQEALVVFETNADVDRLRHLDLANGYHRFEVLPVGYTELTGAQVSTVASWPEVRRVQANRELDYHNDDARDLTGAGDVQTDLGYTGENAHVAVIDSGVDGDHPDLQGNLVANYRYVNPLSSDEDTTWVEAGPADTDDNGHGTHTSGSVGGDGTASDGQYAGMAPDVDLTVYSAGLTLAILKAVAAFDHLVARQRAGETNVQVVSNSWGSSSGADFDAGDAINVATWTAYQEGILPVFSAGNSGPGTNTLNDYAKAPHVLGVAATNDEQKVVDFSSRGRTPDYDGETNYDRKKALDNVAKYHSAEKTDEEVDAGSFTGVVGPAGSQFHEWTAPDGVDYLEASLAWTPGAEDVDFYLHEGGPDGDVVASGATLQEPEELAALVSGGTTYAFEVRPFANVAADYEISYTAYKATDLRKNLSPMGVYRNGVGAPGELVMSTLAPEDPLQAYGAASGEPDAEVWYGRISGTSMSCPVVSGVAALVFDAYSQEHGEFPDPVDVLNTVEATADDVLDTYTPANVGAGFVDAYEAVSRAVDGNLASFGEVKLV